MNAVAFTWLALSLLPSAPQPAERLWPGKAPGAIGDTETDIPKITAYLAEKEKATGAAVVVCPGGGYGVLAADHEGKQVAEYLNKLGISAFVLQYRIATKERPGPLMDAPLLDTQRAIRTVRSKAKDLGIDPARIGLMGFSAGGHLASTAGTKFDDGKNDGDAIDKFGCRPDFLILGYAVISLDPAITHGGSRNNLLGKDASPELIELYSNDKHVTDKTPPTFLFQTDEDKSVSAEHSVRFYLALRKAKVPAELHIYEKGKHGVGLGSDPKWTGGSTYTESWPDRLTAWLKERGALAKK